MRQIAMLQNVYDSLFLQLTRTPRILAAAEPGIAVLAQESYEQGQTDESGSTNLEGWCCGRSGEQSSHQNCARQMGGSHSVKVQTGDVRSAGPDRHRCAAVRTWRKAVARLTFTAGPGRAPA